jgi:hypothetical protein
MSFVTRETCTKDYAEPEIPKPDILLVSVPLSVVAFTTKYVFSNCNSSERALKE